MTTKVFTYSGNPASSPRDELRFLVNDTNKDKALLSDGECDYLLTQAGNVPLLAAIAGIQQMMLQARDYVDQTVGSVSVSWSQRYTNLGTILSSLRQRLVTSGYAGVWAGGISHVGKELNAANPDLLRPQLTARQDKTRGDTDHVVSSANQITGNYP